MASKGNTMGAPLGEIKGQGTHISAADKQRIKKEQDSASGNPNSEKRKD